MISCNTVLCPIDLGPLSEPTVRLGALLAERLGARLVLHHNLDTRPPGFLSVRWMWSEDHEDEAARRAEAAPGRLRDLMASVAGQVETEAKLTRGPFQESLREVAEHVSADLIVMSTAGKSSAEHRSLTEQVIRDAPCTVLTLGEGCDLDRFLAALRRPPQELRVVAPVDLGAGTEDVLAFVAALADGMPHELHVLHVVEGPTEEGATAAEANRARLRRMLPESIRDQAVIDVRAGRVSDEILEAARSGPVLFLVMAAHTQGLWSRTKEGDRTSKILHQSPCPVWFLPTAWRQRSAERLEPRSGGA